MRKEQDGVSLMGLIVALFLVVIVALFAMKIIPSFLEFRSAKTAIEQVARSAQNAGEARRAFENRATIDNIDSVKPSDLEISREGSFALPCNLARVVLPPNEARTLAIDAAALGIRVVR